MVASARRRRLIIAARPLLVRGIANGVVDVENELREIVVPVEVADRSSVDARRRRWLDQPGAVRRQLVDLIDRRNDYLVGPKDVASRARKPSMAGASPCTRKTWFRIGSRSLSQAASSGPSAWPE